MERREFMVGAVAATGLAASRRAWAQAGNDAKLARIAIMMFGLNSIVKTNMPSAPERTLELTEFGELCADRFKVHNIELQSNYFPSTEASWLREFKARLAKTKTKVVQINLEFGAGYNMAADSPSGRLQMIDLHRSWLEKAALLECPRVLLNQGVPSPENRDQLIANYKAVVALAKERHIIGASENRNAPGAGRGAAAAAQAGAAPAPAPPPATPAPPMYLLLTDVLRASGAAACVDMLNFPNQQEQLAGIRHMLPINSGLLHAGMRHDLSAALAVCRDFGYKGLYSVKASGLPGDPVANTQKIIDGLLAEM